jgi:hypothetical protein
MSTAKIVAAFNEAAARLNFEFDRGFSITLHDELLVRPVGLLPHFGSPRGAVIFAESQRIDASHLRELKGMGFFVSVLFESYEAFNQTHFMDTLNDWGYFGPSGLVPTWYSGKSRT